MIIPMILQSIFLRKIFDNSMKIYFPNYQCINKLK